MLKVKAKAKDNPGQGEEYKEMSRKLKAHIEEKTGVVCKFVNITRKKIALVFGSEEDAQAAFPAINGMKFMGGTLEFTGRCQTWGGLFDSESDTEEEVANNVAKTVGDGRGPKLVANWPHWPPTRCMNRFHGPLCQGARPLCRTMRASCHQCPSCRRTMSKRGFNFEMTFV